MSDGDYFASAFVSKADRIRAGPRDSRIAAADAVARADLDATVAVAQGCAQGRGRERTTGDVGLAVAEALAAIGLDVRWVATHPTASGYEARISCRPAVRRQKRRTRET